MNNETNDSETGRQGQEENLSKQGMSNTISESNKRQHPNTIRYFSMFTGVGGFELGLGACNFKPLPTIEQDQQRRNGTTNEQGALLCTGQSSTFTCVGMSEWDKYSSQVLKYRFPNIKNWGDCTKINPSELPDFDMLCGGFPCQSFSIAGKRRGFEDTRGTMFFEIARILKIKRPKIVLLENVKGLLNHNKGETFRVILQTLDELGYETQWMVLNSKFFGVPQNRERVFIIGNIRGERRSEILPFREGERYTDEARGVFIKVEGMLTEDGWDKRHENIRRVYSTEGISPTIPTGQGGGVMPKIRAVLTPNRENKRQNGRRFKEPGEPSFTITKQDIHGVSDGMNIRRLTPTECERLQGFPEGWTLYRKVYKLVKLYGNIWKDVQLKDVEDQFVIRDQNYVLNITKGGKDGETPTLSIQAKEEMEENVVLRGVIEIHTVEDGVCDITNLGKDMVMLYKAKGTPNYEEITNQNLIKEKMEEQSIFPLWKITLEEKLKKEKLSTILTLIKKTILSKTFTCVKTGKPITNAIIVWKRLEQNSLEEESLNLRMENTLLNSDTQRYKMMGNAVTVNVTKAIGDKIDISY